MGAELIAPASPRLRALEGLEEAVGYFLRRNVAPELRQAYIECREGGGKLMPKFPESIVLTDTDILVDGMAVAYWLEPGPLIEPSPQNQEGNVHLDNLVLRVMFDPEETKVEDRRTQKEVKP